MCVCFFGIQNGSRRNIDNTCIDCSGSVLVSNPQQTIAVVTRAFVILCRENFRRSHEHSLHFRWVAQPGSLQNDLTSYSLISSLFIFFSLRMIRLSYKNNAVFIYCMF